jgi:aminopeptidase N
MKNTREKGKIMRRSTNRILFLLLVIAITLAACQPQAPETSTPSLAPASTIKSTPPIPTPAPVKPKRSIGDPFSPELGNMGYDVQQYDIQIAIDPAQLNQLDATVTISAIATVDYPEEISLDFIGYQVKDLQVNGESAEFQRSLDKLAILMPELLTKDTPFTLTIDYSGEADLRQSPYVPFVNNIGPFFPDGESMFIVSEPDGARLWLPCNDHPRDKAIFHYEISVPVGYIAAANGLQVDEIYTEERTTFIWEHDYPMATYLATIAVGKYQKMYTTTPEGIELREYYFRGQEEDSRDAINLISELLPWYEEMLGPYPFEAYGHVHTNTAGLGFEAQTLTVLSNNEIKDDVIAHELAHMWFGDWVSLDTWGEMWRNEGFAKYFEILWMNHDDPQTFKEYMDDLSQRVMNNPDLPALDALTPENLFGYASYYKGAVVVHQLRQEIGDDAFFQGLQTYLATYGGGTATNEDFIRIMEGAAGRPLDDFFDYWLTQ